MPILSGITKETYEHFSKREDNSGKISFVRDASKDKGVIFFGNKQYGIADFDTTDDNLLVDYTDAGGLDINYNLLYDYEFTASKKSKGDWEKLLLLPNGTYNLFVESSCAGHTVNGYATISVDNGGKNHSEFAVNSEILYYDVLDSYNYYLCIPCENENAPVVTYRIKLMGSSVAKKKDITDVHGTYISESAYDYKKPSIIPCITNNSSVININSADITTTYCTTATPEVVSEGVIGKCYILENSTLQNYIINTESIDGSDKVSAVVLSNSADTASTSNLSNGVYRFKFSDGIDSGFVVSCKDTYYEYTGGVIDNAILTLTISDSYSEWTISNPTVYSSDKSVKVVADNYGGFDVTVPDIEIGNKAIEELSGKVDVISGDFLSGITIDGSSDHVTIEDHVADLDFTQVGAGMYENALVCAYYGVKDKSNIDAYNTIVPLFTAKVQNNNGYKCFIRFKLMSVDSEHRSFQAEYIFDAHNVNDDSQYQTLACIDFSNKTYGTLSPATYGTSGLNASLYDVFYTTEETTNSKGKTEWVVKFYKRHLAGYAMFTMLVDYVGKQYDQFDFHSVSYLKSTEESITGSIFNQKFDDDIADRFDSEYRFTHSLSVKGTIDELIGGKTIYYPVDYREGSPNVSYVELNTENKNIIGAINEIVSGGATSKNGLSSVTINSSSEGVSIANNNADLTIKDWQAEIDFLSGRVDLLINSLNVKGEGGGGGGGESADTSAHTEIWSAITDIQNQIININQQISTMKRGTTAVTYSDGNNSYSGFMDSNNVIDLGVLHAWSKTDKEGNPYAYIDETGEWLHVYSKKISAYTTVAIDVLGVEV